jgi:hypothetical protein
VASGVTHDHAQGGDHRVVAVASIEARADVVVVPRPILEEWVDVVGIDEPAYVVAIGRRPVRVAAGATGGEPLAPKLRQRRQRAHDRLEMSGGSRVTCPSGVIHRYTRPDG